MMHKLTHKILVAVFFVFSILLASCGGDSDSAVDTAGDLTTAGKGTVALLVTDAPTDDFKEVNMTVLKAELICDNGNQELFSGVKEFDLLQLTDVTEIFSISEVTAGFCSKIRLNLAQIELVFKDSSKPSVLAKLLGNGKLDLKPKTDFYVGPNDPLYVQLDFDAKKSIHVKSKANYNFRPVVFIKVIKDRFDTKLVRQRGTLENLDGDSEEFDLCLIEAEVQPVSRNEDDDSSDDDSLDCVRVNTTDAPASIFNDLADPVALNQLEEGEIVTVVGRFSFHDSKSDDDSSDDDSSDDRNRPGLVLAAEVIWSGHDIAQTTNVACSKVTTDDENVTGYENYELPIPEAGEICITPEATRTVLQPGAKIYDSEGNALDDSAIAEGILNKVDAYAGPVDLKAVLVMLGLNEPLNPLDQLTGNIGNVDIDFDNDLSNLTLMTDSGDRCVNFDNVETQVFETSLDGDKINFDQKSVYGLRVGQKADVFGTENDGCLDAEIIIYEDQEAETQPI